MEYTQEQLVGFKKDFARKRRRQLWITVLYVPAVISLMVSLRVSEGQGGAWLLGGGMVGLVATLALSLLNWRCPACGQYLGRDKKLSFCPRCGVALNTSDVA